MLCAVLAALYGCSGAATTVSLRLCMVQSQAHKMSQNGCQVGWQGSQSARDMIIELKGVRNAAMTGCRYLSFMGSIAASTALLTRAFISLTVSAHATELHLQCHVKLCQGHVGSLRGDRDAAGSDSIAQLSHSTCSTVALKQEASPDVHAGVCLAN